MAGETKSVCSGAEQGGGSDGDSILAPVALGSGGDDHRIEQLVSDLLRKPAQVTRVRIADVTRELYLDRDHATIRTLDDQVDLVSAAGRAQVLHRGLGRLGIGAGRERHERLEEG